jgi:hypothetical protein
VELDPVTDEQTRLISSLKNDRAYIALLQYLDAQVNDMLGALAEAQTPADILRHTRLWQVAVKFLAQLRSAPEEMDKKLRELADMNPIELNHWGLEDEDPFTSNPRTLPPPYQTAMYSQNAKIPVED